MDGRTDYQNAANIPLDLDLDGFFIAFTKEANHSLHALGLTHNYLELVDPEQCNNLLNYFILLNFSLL